MSSAAAKAAAAVPLAPEIAAFAIHDLAAATFVPYNADGSVNYDGVDAHCRDLARHEVNTAFINGTTGDSMALSEGERKGLAVAWVAAGRKYGVRILNHIGAQGITESCELARHAQEIGCDGVCAMAPQFFKPQGPAGLARWLKAIGAAAPKLPLYYYNFPAITGVDINPLHLIHAIEAIGVPTFRGMKFTDFNCWWFMNCVRHGGGKYDIAYGRDEAMLAGLASGAKGSIGNGFNMAPGVYQRLRKAFFAGDLETARIEQDRANTTINMLNDPRFGSHGLCVARVMYELRAGISLGPPREPFVPITPAEAAALEAELREIGFFTWATELKREV